jgi:glycosyltransferase involved in cell wall biosynthesis
MRFAASVVIPLLYQKDEWLRQSIESALRQSAPTEVIVVHSEAASASNLQLLAWLRQQYCNLRVLVEDKPEAHRFAFPRAVNKGISHASSGRIGLLLSDDWLDETAVAECLPGEADIVSTGNIVHRPDGSVNEEACSRLSLEGFLACPTLERKARYLQHFFFFRKKALVSAGGLDERIGNYPGVDDYDLIWTLLERNATVSIVEKCLYHYRDHDEERLTLKDPEIMGDNLRKIIRKHGIPEGEAADIVAQHSRWFGKPIYRAMIES